MTEEEAIAIMRARWSHPALDLRAVEERVAIRFEHRDTEVRVLEARPACRVFILDGELTPRGGRSGVSGRWCSRYVHTLEDLDATITEIEEEIARAREKRARKADRETRCVA